MMNCRKFSLVEIVLALVVIAVGIIAIMGLFPAGMQANQSAVSQQVANDAGDQFLRYFASQAKRDWRVINALPIDRADGDESEILWQTSDASGIINEVPGVALSYNDEDNDGAFDYLNGPDDNDRSGLFRIVQRTDALAGGTVPDFTGVIRAWKSAATYKAYDRETRAWSGLKPVSPDAGITVNVEISWPENRPYANRDKAIYSMDVFRPSEYETDQRMGAFSIPTTGKLKFTYLGSNAGIKSGFWMSQPAGPDGNPVQIFAKTTSTEQGAVSELTYEGGTAFNFFARHYAGGNSEVGAPRCTWRNAHLMGTYDHHVYAEEGQAIYADWDGNDPENPRDAYSDNLSGYPYSMVMELIPNRKWLIGIEDLPADWDGDGSAGDDWNDFDYEDVVVIAEHVSESGDYDAMDGVQVSGTVRIDMGSTWRCTVAKPNGTAAMVHAGGFSGYSGPALAVWFRAQGSGTQSLNVDGESKSFDNNKMVAVSSEDMDVVIRRTNNHWYVEFDSDNAVFSVGN